MAAAGFRRGLCDSCSRKSLSAAAEIRYATAGRHSPQPTLALPGTAEKIAVLAHRVANKLALRHFADAALDADDRPLPRVLLAPSRSYITKPTKPRRLLPETPTFADILRARVRHAGELVEDDE